MDTHRIVLVLFLAVILVVVARYYFQGHRPKPIRITTDEGTVDTLQELEPNESRQVFTKFTEKQISLVQQNVQWANEIVSRYAEHPVDATSTPKELDAIFAKWLADSSLDKPSGDEIVKSLGSCFGEYLCKNLEMEWVVVSDESGMDGAVRHRTSTIVAYPYSAVQKRVEDRGTDFFWHIYLATKGLIESGEYDLAPPVESGKEN